MIGALILLIASVVVVPWYLKSKRAEAKYQDIVGMVKPGMDIEDARQLLIKAGYQPGEKYFPTKKEDYYLVLIPVGEHTYIGSSLESLEYAITGSKSILPHPRAWVIIEADRHGKVIEVR